MTSKIDILQRASIDHFSIVSQYLRDIEKNDGVFFSTDKSFLHSNFLSLIRDSSFLNWALPISDLVKKLKIQYHKVLPIYEKEYSRQEIKEIKLTIHSLISLNQIIYIKFTNDMNFLETNFMSSNLFASKKTFSIESTNPYIDNQIFRFNVTENDYYEVFADLKDPKVRGLNSFYKLSIKKNYFNTSNSKEVRSNLKKYYGEFLFRLQFGKCAITSEKGKLQDMEVDHIIPCSKGGTNALINLQLVKNNENTIKGSCIIKESIQLFSSKELIDLGLSNYIDYNKIADRTLSENPFFITKFK